MTLCVPQFPCTPNECHGAAAEPHAVPSTSADGCPHPFPRHAGWHGCPAAPAVGEAAVGRGVAGPPHPIPGRGGRCRPGQGRPGVLSPAGAAPAAVGPSGTSSATGCRRAGPLPRAGSGAIPDAWHCENRMGGGSCVPPHRPPPWLTLVLMAAGWTVPQFPLGFPCWGARRFQGAGVLCALPL